MCYLYPSRVCLLNPSMFGKKQADSEIPIRLSACRVSPSFPQGRYNPAPQLI
jgi:hypothetical protein